MGRDVAAAAVAGEGSVKSTGPDDLRAIGDPLAAELLPGWRVTWQWVDPADIGGALAMIYPDPKRQMARICVAPHPEGEDVAESIAHEIMHGVVSPLVELTEQNAAEIAIEEPIVERLGVLVARLWKACGGLARASLRREVATYATAEGVRFRMRISAGAGQRARGDAMAMNIDTVKALLEAIEAKDAEKMGEVCKQLIAEAASGTDAGAPPKEPDGDEPPGDPMNKDPNKPAPAGPPAAGPAPGGGGADYRSRLAAIDADAARLARARKEAEDITASLRKGAKEQLIDALRARLPADHKGLPAVEKRILAAGDYGAAKMIFDLAIEMAPEATAGARARGSDRQTASPNLGTKPPIVKPADLDKFDPAFQQMWAAVAEHEGQEAADRLLVPARARLARDAAQGRN